MWCWIAGLSLILVQSIFKPLHLIALSGEEWVPHIEDVSLEKIENQTFQKEVDHWTTKKFGFRELSVRFYNQLLYSLFDEVTYFIEIGREDYLFEKAYRSAICGEHTIEPEAVANKLDSMNLLNTLLEERGKKLIVVLAPNKYRFFSDKIDVNCVSSNTNYEMFKVGFDRGQYAFFNFIELFPKMKSEYPLMPKSGTHWSLYGAYRSAMLVQDSLVQWGFAGAALEIGSLETDVNPRETDKDLHNLLNVMSYAPTEFLAYPKPDYKHDKKPRMLVVGDSFYETFYRTGIHSKVYHEDSKHLYYNKKMFGQDGTIGHVFDREELQEELVLCDAIMIVSNEAALKTYAWGFLTDAIEILNE